MLPCFGLPLTLITTYRINNKINNRAQSPWSAPVAPRWALPWVSATLGKAFVPYLWHSSGSSPNSAITSWTGWSFLLLLPPAPRSPNPTQPNSTGEKLKKTSSGFLLPQENCLQSCVFKVQLSCRLEVHKCAQGVAHPTNHFGMYGHSWWIRTGAWNTMKSYTVPAPGKVTGTDGTWGVQDWRSPRMPPQNSFSVCKSPPCSSGSSGSAQVPVGSAGSGSVLDAWALSLPFSWPRCGQALLRDS